MPKLRMSDEQIQDAFLRQAIKGSAGFFQLSSEELARAAGCARATWYRRINQPETFTLAELRRMVKRFHWTAMQVGSFVGVKEERK